MASKAPAQVARKVRPKAPVPAPVVAPPGLRARLAGRLPAGLRSSRYGLALVGAGEAALLLVSAGLAFAFPTDTTPHPERVTAAVTNCDLSLHGAAQVTFTVTNGDRVEHSYTVNVVVSGRANQLGAGTSLVNHVGQHATETARALLQVNGDTAGATCQLRAVPFDGETGHHG